MKAFMDNFMCSVQHPQEAGPVLILNWQIRNLRPEWLSNLPEVTQPLQDRAGIQVQAGWLQVHILDPVAHS